MNLFKKVKAFFTHEDSPVEMDLASAEIKEGRAYLHPKGEEKITYMVRSNDIRIQLGKGRSISSADIIKIGPKDPGKKKTPADPKKDPEKQKTPSSRPPKSTEPVYVRKTDPNEFDRFKKRKFTVTLYQEDYDALMSSMKGYGYKRADFVMACVNSASKTTMERAHKKIQKTNKQRLEEEKAMTLQQPSAEV